MKFELGLSDRQLTENSNPAKLTYSNDIYHLFRDVPDVVCMNPHGVMLHDSAWMCVLANAETVYQAIASHYMPKDGPWPPEKIALFKNWMDQGCNP
jgi:hypothetical protein